MYRLNKSQDVPTEAPGKCIAFFPYQLDVRYFFGFGYVEVATWLGESRFRLFLHSRSKYIGTPKLLRSSPLVRRL